MLFNTVGDLRKVTPHKWAMRGSPQRSLPDIFPYNAETLSASWQTLVLPHNSPFAQSLRKLQKSWGFLYQKLNVFLLEEEWLWYYCGNTVGQMGDNKFKQGVRWESTDLGTVLCVNMNLNKISAHLWLSWWHNFQILTIIAQNDISVWVCVWVCVCVFERERENKRENKREWERL